MRLIFLLHPPVNYCAVDSSGVTQIPRRCSHARNEILYLRESECYFHVLWPLRRHEVSREGKEDGKNVTFTSQKQHGEGKSSGHEWRAKAAHYEVIISLSPKDRI